MNKGTRNNHNAPNEKQLYTLTTESLDLCLDRASRRSHIPIVGCPPAFLFLGLQVKSYYNIMMETIKQTSLQNIQGDLGGHMETLSVKDGAGKAQQALTLQKVDMEASVMEVSFRLFASPRAKCRRNSGLCSILLTSPGESLDGLRELPQRRVLRLQQRPPSLREVHHLPSGLLHGGPVFGPRRQDLSGRYLLQRGNSHGFAAS